MDYPASTLVLIKGKYYVSVTVPKRLEYLFTQKQIRLSTGTSDRNEAQQRQHNKASQIYARFDEAATSQNSFTVEQVHALLQAICDELQLGFDVSETMTRVDGQSRKLVRILDDLVNQAITGSPDTEGSLSEKFPLIEPMLGAYCHETVQSFLRKYRKKPRPIEPTPEFIISAPATSYDPTTRLRSLTQTYANTRNWQRLKSKDAAVRQIEKFADCIGDLEVRELQKQHAYAFASALQSENKAQKTIASYVSAVSAMLTWCEQNGIVDESPFTNLKLSNYGTKKKSWLPMSSDELHALFAQNMDDQDRLLLSILVTTGMRLDEAALLTWEQLKSIDGVRCFDLTDAILKNTSSERLVALPDCLKLPPRGTGRIFSYALDTDGKASRRASRVLGPLICNVTKNRRVVTHSLRGTLKDLLRDANVSKEINDFITGHSGGDVASKYGNGPSLQKRFEAINLISHPWLTP